MNFHRLSHSIVTRLLLIGIGMTLFGAAVRYVLLTDFLSEDIGKLVAGQQARLAVLVAREIDGGLRDRQLMLEGMAEALPPALLRRPAELGAWLKARQRSQPAFAEGLAVVDESGRIVAASTPRPGEAEPLDGGVDWARQAAAGRFAIGRPLVDGRTRHASLPMAAPIRGAQGEVAAVLLGKSGLSTSGLLAALQDASGEDGSLRLVLPAAGLVIAPLASGVVLQPVPPALLDALQRAAVAGSAKAVTVNRENGKEISAAAPLSPPGWWVVASLPTKVALAPLYHAQDYAVSHVGLVISIFLVLASGGLFAVFRPLLLAADHAEKMARGEAPLAPLAVAHDDEVGHLTAAFNRLLARLKQTQAELLRMAHHDTLTGLPNRVLLADRLRQALGRAHRNGTRMATLFLDLDGFKPINDAHGHETGDATLVEVARRLRNVVRETDTLARVGGDEFVILIGELSEEPEEAVKAARAVAAKCVKALAAPIRLGDAEFGLGVSVGIALGDGASDGDALMSLADGAMYRAKEAGRGCFVVAEALAA